MPIAELKALLTDLGSINIPDSDAPVILKDTCNYKSGNTFN